VGGGASGWMVVVVFVLFACVGGVAGWWGTRLGRRVLERSVVHRRTEGPGMADPHVLDRHLTEPDVGENDGADRGSSAVVAFVDQDRSAEATTRSTTSIWRGWAVAAVCALAIGLALTGRVVLAGVGLGTAILAVLWYDPSVLRRFAHLRLWLALVVFAALGGFFLSRSSDVGSRWLVGGTVALTMMGRAVTFLFVAVLAARHLSMEQVGAMAGRLGLSRWFLARRLGWAVADAWRLVPEAMRRIRQAHREVGISHDVAAGDEGAARKDRAVVPSAGWSRWPWTTDGWPMTERAAMQLLEWAVTAGGQGTHSLEQESAP